MAGSGVTDNPEPGATPPLANRMHALLPDGDDGWGMVDKARALQADGVDVVMLTIGDHDFVTPEPIVDALIDSLHRGRHHYAEIPGIKPLRQAIAARSTRLLGVETSAAEVVVVSGGQGGLFASLMCVLDHGDDLLLFEPAYVTYDITPRSIGLNPIRVACPPDDHFQPQRADIEAALTPNTRAMLVNSPNNPTGVVYRPETLQMLADVAVEHDLWLVSDEVYETQVYGQPHRSLRQYAPERTLVIGSVSKSHAMTGWRLGWVIGPAGATAMMGTLGLATTYGVAMFVQDAAVTALTECDVGVSRTIHDLYGHRRRVALDALGRGPGARPVAPDGAMYLMIDVRETGRSGVEFAEGLLAAERIAVMPGESFGTAAAGHIRVALTNDDDVLIDSLGRLAAYAANLVPS